MMSFGQLISYRHICENWCHLDNLSYRHLFENDKVKYNNYIILNLVKKKI